MHLVEPKIFFSRQLVQSPSSAIATRVSGIPSVESPGSFNPPSISNPGSQESPVKLSDKEELLYVEKVSYFLYTVGSYSNRSFIQQQVFNNLFFPEVP